MRIVARRVFPSPLPRIPTIFGRTSHPWYAKGSGFFRAFFPVKRYVDDTAIRPGRLAFLLERGAREPARDLVDETTFAFSFALFSDDEKNARVVYPRSTSPVRARSRDSPRKQLGQRERVVTRAYVIAARSRGLPTHLKIPRTRRSHRPCRFPLSFVPARMFRPDNARENLSLRPLARSLSAGLVIVRLRCRDLGSWILPAGIRRLASPSRRGPTNFIR